MNDHVSHLAGLFREFIVHLWLIWPVSNKQWPSDSSSPDRQMCEMAWLTAQPPFLVEWSGTIQRSTSGTQSKNNVSPPLRELPSDKRTGTKSFWNGASLLHITLTLPIIRSFTRHFHVPRLSVCVHLSCVETVLLFYVWNLKNLSSDFQGFI